MSVPLISVSVDGCSYAIAIDPDGIRAPDENPITNLHKLTFEQEYEPSDGPPLSVWVEELEEILDAPMISRVKLKNLYSQIFEFSQKEVDKIQIEVEWDETC
jgi:hypothetical protein